MIAMNKNMKGWRVYFEGIKGRAGKLIDIVFYDSTMDAQEVKQSLINHDGFPSNIIVLPDREI